MSFEDAPRPEPGRISLFSASLAGLIVFVACLLWMPHLEKRLNPLTGDEPFYVMTSISIVNDHDLDERNNFDQRDYDRFYPAFGPTPDGWPSYPDPLPPHRSQTKRAGLYSKHGLGMALIVALPFELGGRTLTLIVLAAIAALVTANMSLLARMSVQSESIPIAVSLLLGLTNPLLSFSLLIFPEMTAALCIVYAIRRLLSPRNAWWQWLLVGLAAAFLPWLHYRLAPISLVLALIAIARFRRALLSLNGIIAGMPAAISVSIMFWWYERLYGTPRPPSSDHAGFSSFSGTLNGLAGTFLDQQWGAALHNPLIVLALATFGPFFIWHRRDAITIAIVVIPYLGLISAYRVWWGEWNPPGRYLTDIVPLAAAPLAWWLGATGRRLAVMAVAFAAIPAFAVMATFIADPQWMYNHPDGTSRLFETWRGWTPIDLTQTIPSYVSYSLSPVDDRVIFGLLGFAIVGTIGTVATMVVKKYD